MSITDELREWMRIHHILVGGLTELTDIADRIDAEHERIVRETGEEIVRDVRREWVRLPVDADGAPINIGDVMEWPTTGETFEVVGIGHVVLFYVEDGKECADWTGASTKRHHVPDTFASIIEDAIGDRIEDRAEFDKELDALVARCKALAGGAS